MANINIKFNNKDYLLSCDDGQEENLKKLANHLDSKYNELKKDLGNIGENKLLLITAIKMVDDYFDLFKKVKNKKNDFEKLSIKFKELRSLAINYKSDNLLYNIASVIRFKSYLHIIIVQSKIPNLKILDQIRPAGTWGGSVFAFPWEGPESRICYQFSTAVLLGGEQLDIAHKKNLSAT